MNEELNKKLAEWAGFRFEFAGSGSKISELYGYDVADGVDIVIYPDGGWDLGCDAPDFTESLDAVFQRLVPKAIDKIMTKQECSSDLAYAILFKKWLQELELDIPQYASTLCKAIEQLIRGE